MILQHRQMRPKDVHECVEIIATHPVIGPRYGRSIEDLGPAWLQLLGRDAVRSTVIEVQEDGQVRIGFVGVSLCVDDDFIRDLKTPPIGWFGPELLKRVMRGDSLALTDKQVRECNSKNGLNLLVWEGCIRSGFETHIEIYREIIRAFLGEHQGFFWKEVIGSQMESIERFQWTLSTGGFWWDPAEGKYADAVGKDHTKIVAEPHIIGMTRALEVQRHGSWVGDLFNYRPPRCGFSRSEQHLLLSALSGATDEELAKTLCVSLPTVKKTWLSIYGRVAARQPQLIENHSLTESSVYRGKEKRRRLLAYLRDHLEELRPFSLKLLQ
jgi:hypothetical protein